VPARARREKKDSPRVCQNRASRFGKVGQLSGNRKEGKEEASYTARKSLKGKIGSHGAEDEDCFKGKKSQNAYRLLNCGETRWGPGASASLMVKKREWRGGTKARNWGSN